MISCYLQTLKLRKKFDEWIENSDWDENSFKEELQYWADRTAAKGKEFAEDVTKNFEKAMDKLDPNWRETATEIMEKWESVEEFIKDEAVSGGFNMIVLSYNTKNFKYKFVN